MRKCKVKYGKIVKSGGGRNGGQVFAENSG